MYYIGNIPCVPEDELMHYGRKGMKWGKDIFGNVANNVGNAARSAGNAVSGAAKTVGNAAGNAAKSVGSAVGSGANKAKAAVGSGVKVADKMLGVSSTKRLEAARNEQESVLKRYAYMNNKADQRFVNDYEKSYQRKTDNKALSSKATIHENRANIQKANANTAVSTALSTSSLKTGEAAAKTFMESMQQAQRDSNTAEALRMIINQNPAEQHVTPWTVQERTTLNRLSNRADDLHNEIVNLDKETEYKPYRIVSEAYKNGSSWLKQFFKR